MTPRNIIIIVFIFIFLVVILAFFFGARQNAVAQNGLASIDQVGMVQTLPPPSTVPPPQYITVPTAYYIGSANTTETVTAPTPVTRTRTVTTPAPAPVKAPVDVNYWYYRWTGNDYVIYYPNTPDHKAPRTAEDVAYYPY